MLPSDSGEELSIGICDEDAPQDEFPSICYPVSRLGNEDIGSKVVVFAAAFDCVPSIVLIEPAENDFFCTFGLVRPSTRLFDLLKPPQDPSF